MCGTKEVEEFIEYRVTFKPSMKYGLGPQYRRSLGYRLAILDFIEGREAHNPFFEGSVEGERYNAGVEEVQRVERQDRAV